MNRELIIESNDKDVVIAFLEDKKLVELHKEKTDNNFSVGDIYLGKVKKVIHGLNAAFVDVGYDKDAFLHYLDLGPQIKSLNSFIKDFKEKKINTYKLDNFEFKDDIDKNGKISQVLSANQNILVQIAKEPISTKGPRVSSELSLAGRYLVLVPFSDKISVSQKIRSPEERNRLKRLVQSIKPKNFSVIIRTVAENKKVADLDADLNNLVLKWKTLTEKLETAKVPQRIMGEIDRTSVILRDLLNESFNSIHVDNKQLSDEIINYIQTISPEKAEIVKHYKGKLPIFEHFGIDKQIKSAFGKNISIKGGAYIIIEHTEAMHVIDVNSGHHIKAENNQEDNALAVNLEAAEEISRQLRLRDMGGIIVVDFIDLHLAVNRRKLYDKLLEVMKYDRAKHNILPPSKFGLVQITRQRVRPEMVIETMEKCPACGGSGEVKASIVITYEIEKFIKYLAQEQNENYLKIIVHPFIHAYLTKGLISLRLKWILKYKVWVKISSSVTLSLLEYHFFNKADDEYKI
ncbi:MAG: Rne/Rng family ribonuclease [Bacteroidales bacterium]|nr:Rne/Rng family ribonuclease [Bacteroidales bacterium]